MKITYLAHQRLQKTFVVMKPSSSYHLQFQQIFALGDVIVVENIHNVTR